MSKCISCGGELVFDIATQSLRCPFCEQKRDPRAYRDTGGTADEKIIQEMDVYLYSCPQCGGSIYSAEESVNGFCSYCGSNVMISSRMAKMRYPRYVAPFRIDKESCKQNYLKYVKKAFFAPKEMRDPQYLDHFRGIYMSYWGYEVTLKGFISLDGVKSLKVGRNVLTERYTCRGWLNAVYDNIFYDASSSFEDHFSEQIAPFDYNGLMEFTPAYLAGFYADLPDLPDDVYLDNALQLAKEKAYAPSRLRKAFPGVQFDDAQGEKLGMVQDVYCSDSYTTFFPIWFLAYRNKDRVAYAVVNGQTGRIACDLPIDLPKFIISGVALAAVIFLMLCARPPLPPYGLLVAGICFSLFSILLLMHMVQKVYLRKAKIYDKGYMSKTGQLNYKYVMKVESDKRLEEAEKKGLIPIVVAAVLICVPIYYRVFLSLYGGVGLITAILLCMVTEVVVLRNTLLIFKLDPDGKWKLLLGMWMIFLSSLYCLCLIVGRSAKVDDVYLAVFLQMIGTLIAQIMSIEQYNLLSTRPLPQLNRKGGDTNAQA